MNNPDFDLAPPRCLWGVFRTRPVPGRHRRGRGRVMNTSNMSWGSRKRLKFGPLALNLSKRHGSVSTKFGRFSTNTRTRRLRVSLPFEGWWHSRSLSRGTRSRR
jgi:hypothetical protein